MSRFRVRLLVWVGWAGLMLIVAFSLPGCLGGGDGNPPRGSISAPRDKEGTRKGGAEAREDFKSTKTKAKARYGSVSKTSRGP
jgi:hypothetical protein